MTNLKEMVFSSLKTSALWNNKTKVDGQGIKYLTCPHCEKQSVWLSSGLWLRCNHINTCSFEANAKEYLNIDIEKKFPPTNTDKHRPARIYLKSRKLSKSLENLKFEYHSKTRKGCGGAVMFSVITNNGNAKNGRLINPPVGAKNKSHNIGKTKGAIWNHPDFNYENEKELYLAESIIDALSLLEHGFQAKSICFSGNNPENIPLSELDKFSKIIIAFNNDKAGRDAAKKYHNFFFSKGQEHSTMLPPEGKDWNDLLIKNNEKFKEIFEKDTEDYQFYGKLALSNTAQEYVDVYKEYEKYPPSLFIFDGCYYSSKKTKENNISIRQVSDFTLSVDHFRIDNSIIDEPVYKYFLKIKPQKGRTISCAASANELSSNNSLKTMFLQRAKVWWDGKESASSRLVKKIVETPSPEVRQMQMIGYDIISKCYVFKDFMITPKGEKIYPNKKGFFNISGKEFIMPSHITTIKPKKEVDPAEMQKLIYKAWGDKGITGLAWCVASWFSNQIKEELGFFPFLSFYGDTQTGKSVLTRHLNACQCLDDEGLPMRKTNTGKGEIRRLAQRSGIFQALLEGNKGAQLKFDLNSLLTLYNKGNPLQVRALKTTDNRTQEIPFLSSILFVQNYEPFEKTSQKERVISLKFIKEELNDETAKAFEALNAISLNEYAYFFPYVMRHRNKIEADFKNNYPKNKEILKAAIKNNRIAENHAIILTFHQILSEILHSSYNLQPYVEKIAEEKCLKCVEHRETLADLFFQTLAEIDDDYNNTGKHEKRFKYINKENKELFFNLPGCLKKIKNENFLFISPVNQLQDSLKDHPAFIDANKAKKLPNNNNRTTKCWVFNLQELFDES